MFARALSRNFKTLRLNFFTFSLRDFMQDSFIQGYPPPPNQPKKIARQITHPVMEK
ncbi:type III restriction endonuclease subunit R [Helicobacter pylori]|uniref:type III restriction endonuclease subunit R n=1 Tax=Helicobacter pylori TaxID=210 RepID=UPI00117AD301|nr:type III restriction endonuclease subunit R [Helicobacter pylori]